MTPQKKCRDRQAGLPPNHHEAKGAISSLLFSVPLRLTRSRGAFLCQLQGHGLNAGRSIETGLAGNRERLQRHRVFEATDQRTGAGTDADGGLRRCTAVGTDQTVGALAACCVDNLPQQYGRTVIADVGAELADLAVVVVGRALRRLPD